MTVGVGSPDVSRNSRPSEVTTHAGSPNAQSLSLHGDYGRRKSGRESELLTVGSPDIGGSAGRLSVLIGTPDVRWKFRLSELLTQAGSPGIIGAGWLFNCTRWKF